MKSNNNYRRRKLMDRAMRLVCLLMALSIMIPLFSLATYVVVRGLKRFDLNFFMHLPAPVGEAGGGMANAIVGTLTMIAIASCVSLPISILAGIYLAEAGKKSWFPSLVRFTADVLSGVPSIVAGIFVYQVLVKQMHQFSALAGGLALAILMVPLVTRTTEELIKLVPRSMMEGSLALGAPQWKTTLFVVLHAARAGIATGVLLALARIAGETAPLLFTSLNNQFWPSAINQPTASLTVQVFTFAISPFKDWQDQAWTGALVLLMLVLGVSILSRVFLKGGRGLAN